MNRHHGTTGTDTCAIIIPVLTPNSRQEGGTRPQDPTGEERGERGPPGAGDPRRGGRRARGGARAAGLERPLARGRTIVTISESWLLLL